ncbi:MULTISPECIES: carbon-nitrogen hydrolase family protein [Salinicola]|uniref:carbon-nitrogen hydrolase family protein n=1 Tax=Salinicola TaxID=404432 RepID=UPI000DA13598|nr:MULTISPECIES: carbon-nitrogen hydrolase family protein [Salinicola]
MQIAAWQALSTHGDIATNLARLDESARRAAAEGAALLITPEMFLTGYVLGDDTRRLAQAAPLERAREIAARHAIGLVVGGPEIESGACYNAAHLIADDGQVLARYHKAHLFGDVDRDQFTAGDRATCVADYRGVRIALLICYDVEFPESVRAAARQGAELICVPTAQMQPFAHVNRRLIPTRAWESQVYVAYTNQHGHEAAFDYVGHSLIVAPNGEPLAEAPSAGEALIHAEIDPAAVAAGRAANPYLDDLRQELFTP